MRGYISCHAYGPLDVSMEEKDCVSAVFKG